MVGFTIFCIIFLISKNDLIKCHQVENAHGSPIWTFFVFRLQLGYKV